MSTNTTDKEVRAEKSDRELAFLFCQRILNNVHDEKGREVFRALYIMPEFAELVRVAGKYITEQTKRGK